MTAPETTTINVPEEFGWLARLMFKEFEARMDPTNQDMQQQLGLTSSQSTEEAFKATIMRAAEQGYLMLGDSFCAQGQQP